MSERLDNIITPDIAQFFDLAHFVRTSQGVALLESQQPFVAKGAIWQGYERRCMPVQEMQVTDEELESFQDIDGTKDQVWLVRRQRLGSALMRKSKEYSERRAQLRAGMNEIFRETRERKELGLPPSPSSQRDLDEIDRRMELLGTLQEQAAVRTADDALKPKEPEPVLRLEASCGAMSPEGHRSPDKWKRGHEVGCPKCKQAKGR